MASFEGVGAVRQREITKGANETRVELEPFIELEPGGPQSTDFGGRPLNQEERERFENISERHKNPKQEPIRGIDAY